MGIQRRQKDLERMVTAVFGHVPERLEAMVQVAAEAWRDCDYLRRQKLPDRDFAQARAARKELASCLRQLGLTATAQVRGAKAGGGPGPLSHAEKEASKEAETFRRLMTEAAE